MRFSVATILAFAATAFAQTADFDPIYTPKDGETIPAGSTYTITWKAPAKYSEGTVKIGLIGGATQGTQVPLIDIACKLALNKIIEMVRTGLFSNTILQPASRTVPSPTHGRSTLLLVTRRYMVLSSATRAIPPFSSTLTLSTSRPLATSLLEARAAASPRLLLCLVCLACLAAPLRSRALPPPAALPSRRLLLPPQPALTPRPSSPTLPFLPTPLWLSRPHPASLLLFSLPALLFSSPLLLLPLLLLPVLLPPLLLLPTSFASAHSLFWVLLPPFLLCKERIGSSGWLCVFLFFHLVTGFSCTYGTWCALVRGTGTWVDIGTDWKVSGHSW